MNYYLQCLQKYATFSGRARRKEIWMFWLFNCLAAFIVTFVENIIGLQMILSGLYSLFIFLPSLSVSVRRLHDTDKSGWFVLLPLIPIVGGLILFIFLYCLDSQPGSNKYGENPKE